MIEAKTIQKVKDTLIVLALGAVISIVPFYFRTSAMTTEAKRVNEQQTILLEETKAELHALEIKGAIDKTEIEQIKQSLARIEGKIDKLIDEK